MGVFTYEMGVFDRKMNHYKSHDNKSHKSPINYYIKTLKNPKITIKTPKNPLKIPQNHP
jgi:hypothetical protein